MKFRFFKVGTRSVLFGAHCFFIHPFFVFLAWWRLYGFPWDPRLWFAFFLHDLGYIGKPNMDGEEGETHPFWGAFIMGALFGRKWYEFTLYHSRFLAKKHGALPSKLCFADKLAFAYTPRWLYLPMVNLTGEVKEYMALAEQNNTKAGTPGKYASMKIGMHSGQKEWHRNVARYMKRWVIQHKDGSYDTWTPSVRTAVDTTGTY